jgi:hypothetical protein
MRMIVLTLHAPRCSVLVGRRHPRNSTQKEMTNSQTIPASETSGPTANPTNT